MHVLMTPVLFAMVDAVLEAEAFEAGRKVAVAAFMPLGHYTLAAGRHNDALDLLGWWRSTWEGR